MGLKKFEFKMVGLKFKFVLAVRYIEMLKNSIIAKTYSLQKSILLANLSCVSLFEPVGRLVIEYWNVGMLEC